MTIVVAVICELKFCLQFGMGVKLGLQRQDEIVRESSAEEDIWPQVGPDNRKVQKTAY